MSELKTIDLALIDENPYRDLARNPLRRAVLEEIKQSMDVNGFFEGVIVRPHGDRYQLAFGHHRIAAAVENGLTEGPFVVKDLSDEEMLRYLLHENIARKQVMFGDLYECFLATIDRDTSVSLPEIAESLGIKPNSVGRYLTLEWCCSVKELEKYIPVKELQNTSMRSVEPLVVAARRAEQHHIAPEVVREAIKTKTEDKTITHKDAESVRDEFPKTKRARNEPRPPTEEEMRKKREKMRKERDEYVKKMKRRTLESVPGAKVLSDFLDTLEELEDVLNMVPAGHDAARVIMRKEASEEQVKRARKLLSDLEDCIRNLAVKLSDIKEVI